MLTKPEKKKAAAIVVPCSTVALKPCQARMGMAMSTNRNESRRALIFPVKYFPYGESALRTKRRLAFQGAFCIGLIPAAIAIAIGNRAKIAQSVWAYATRHIYSNKAAETVAANEMYIARVTFLVRWLYKRASPFGVGTICFGLRGFICVRHSSEQRDTGGFAGFGEAGYADRDLLCEQIFGF